MAPVSLLDQEPLLEPGRFTSTAPARKPPPSSPAGPGPSPPPRNARASTRWPTWAPTCTPAPKPAANHPPAQPWTDSCPGRSTPTTEPPGPDTPTPPDPTPPAPTPRTSPRASPNARLTPHRRQPAPAGNTLPADRRELRILRFGLLHGTEDADQVAPLGDPRTGPPVR